MFQRLRVASLAKTVFCCAITAAAICLPVAAQQANSLPALIDRELLFGNPEIAGAQISPDGKQIMFRKPYKGTLNIYVKKAEEPFANAKLITNRTDRPIAGAFWSRDSRFILFTQDQGGDENFNVYSVNPVEPAAAGAEVPAARNLTAAKGVRALIYGVPESEPDAIYVGINERDKAWHDLYKVKISTGEKTLVQENKDRIGGYVFDNTDKMRLALRTPANGDTEVLRLDADGKATVIYTCNLFETCAPVRFHKDNQRVYMQSNKGAADLTGLILLDVNSGKEEMVESDPKKRVDFGNADFSDLTDELIATTYEDERERVYFKDKKYEADHKFLQSKFPGKDIGWGSRTTDEQIFLVSIYSDTEPGETVLFNRKTRQIVPQYKAREKVNRADLAEMKSVTYKSSDGLDIPAFLTLPKGSNGKNLPVVIVPHGGPWGRDYFGYNSYHQFLANRGYAVLSPNFRASTGYGKKFLNAGNLEWGRKMQDDITWGVKYLVEQGIADPKRVGILGGSYGGYATLAGVTFTPDLYQAAVAIVAPSNLGTLLESIPPYWEAGRVIFYKRMGDPNTDEGKQLIKERSPLTYVDKIKTPLLVVQGANDPRVNKRESDQIVMALRDRGFPVEYIVAPDEGHGFARPVNNMAMLARAEAFLAKHLGGRFQESATPEVAARLKEITVDPKTVVVTYKKSVDMTAAPTVNATGKWNLTANVGGQSLPITLDLKQDGANATGTLTSMMGGGTITDGKISDSTLLGTAKIEAQGQTLELKIEATIENDKMTGTLNGAGFPPINFTAVKDK